MKFKCKQSGNVFEFFNEHDIKTMRSHPEYEEIIEQQIEVSKDEPEPKRLGRPKKTLVPE